MKVKIDFAKYSDGLVPAIIQDYDTHKVLMMGFMNEEALNKTMREGKVSFYSRSKKRIWTRGGREWELFNSERNFHRLRP